MMENETLLTPDELVERWKGTVKAGTLATWRCKGGGPKFTKIGGRVKYRLAEVERYESERTVSGGEKTK